MRMSTQRSEQRSSLYYVALFLGLSLLLCTQSCKKENEVDPGFGPNGEPRILAVRIPDIPDQNIQINQDTKQITVTIPTSYSASFLKPTLTLTPSTTVAYGNDYILDIFAVASNFPLLISTTNNKTNTYTMVLKPAGDLRFGTLSGPQAYSVGNQTNYICLPVYNYVDGSGYQNNTLTLINKVSGERVQPSVVVFGRESICNRTSTTDGATIVSIYLNGYETYYKPGDYTVELAKPNGRTATLAQTIQLLKGTTQANFNANYTFQLNSGDYLLYGSNFYKDDKLSVRIQGRNQPALTLDALGFVDKQPGIRLPTAINLTPGYYYAQLLVNGIATPSTGRITISDQARPLIIEALSLPGQATLKNLLGDSYSFDTPIVLTRGVAYSLNANYYLFTQNDSKAIKQLRLTGLDDPAQVYTIMFGSNPPTGVEQITFPGTLPAGRYQLTIQVVRGDGTVIDGIPLERDVVIQ